MKGSSNRASTVDRIATAATLAVAVLILGMVALTARSGAQPTLAATTIAMAYSVGPFVPKAIRHLQATATAVRGSH